MKNKFFTRGIAILLYACVMFNLCSFSVSGVVVEKITTAIEAESKVTGELKKLLSAISAQDA